MKTCGSFKLNLKSSEAGSTTLFFEIEVASELLFKKVFRIYLFYDCFSSEFRGRFGEVFRVKVYELNKYLPRFKHDPLKFLLRERVFDVNKYGGQSTYAHTGSTFEW